MSSKLRFDEYLARSLRRVLPMDFNSLCVLRSKWLLHRGDPGEMIRSARRLAFANGSPALPRSLREEKRT